MKRTEIAGTLLSHYARVSRRSAARAALAACVIATLPAAGCRSGRSSWNMFSRSEPSAEVLAGSGPTTTYPAPPSSRDRPEAIASIAGGTAADATTIASNTPETASPQTVGNPYALAGNRMKTPENSVPTGFPTGPAEPTGTPATVSTTVATNDGAVPPSYALPGRSGVPASSDLAATANGYDGVPAAVSPDKPAGADGLPSGYQLGKEPVAGPDAALASASPISTSPSSSFAMPPMESLAATGAPETTASGGFGLPSDMIPPPIETVAAAPSAAPNAITGGAATVEPAKTATSPAIAALALPPAESASPVNAQATPGAAASPAYQTASATKSNPTPSGAGAASTGVQPVGYMPGSTGKSTAYPVLR